MTKEEMKARIAEIERECIERKKSVYQLYAETGGKFKCGDMVSDGSMSILVDRVSFSFMAGDIVYYGPVLTKKGVPRKDGERMHIFEEFAFKITFSKKKS